MGDSITYGQHVDIAKAWPRLLPDTDIIVAGVPGDTTRLGLERFAGQVQGVEPDIVVIQFGHNDCNRWQSDRGLPRVSPKAYEANLTEMIDRARTFEIVPVLCSITPSARSEEHARDVDRYDTILRRVADNESVPLADVSRIFLRSPDWETVLVMADGIHLTERGHGVYAAVVQQTLDQMARG